MRRLMLVVIVICSAGIVHAANESDQVRSKLSSIRNEDNAASAGALAGMINDAAAKVASATHFRTRRDWEILLNDLQDAIGSMRSAEAAKSFASILPRSGPDAQVVLCMGMKSLPANTEIDNAAMGLLRKDGNFRINVAVLELLGAHKHAPAVEKILPLLDTKAFPSVQICSLRALAAIPDKASVPAIMKYVGALQGDGGRYVYEATAALRALTGENFVANLSELKRWWEKNEKEFAFDPSKMKTPAFNYELSEKSDVDYYEIPVVENRLVFVLDCSGSMQLGGTPNRLERAKEALKLVISRLKDKQLFNIVMFNSISKRWKQTPPLVPATDVNRKEAAAYIESLKFGGNTQTATTMEDTLREVAVATGCETIYLVTDGNPTPWSQEITNEIQERHISWINESLKVRINTIGIYTSAASDAKLGATGEDKEKMASFLKKLAEKNDGIYREVK